MLEAGAALQGLRHIKGVISAGYPSTLILLPLANRILFDKQFNGKPESMRFQYLASNGLYSVDSRYECSKTGRLKTVKVEREVIAFGGTFDASQILKLGSIGLHEELEALNIPVVVDLHAVVSQLINNSILMGE